MKKHFLITGEQNKDFKVHMVQLFIEEFIRTVSQEGQLVLRIPHYSTGVLFFGNVKRNEIIVLLMQTTVNTLRTADSVVMKHTNIISITKLLYCLEFFLKNINFMHTNMHDCNFDNH